MDEFTVRPPEHPKPSSQSKSLSANQLRNRLRLGHHHKQNADGNTGTVISGENNSVTVKGFGERQFDISDSHEPESNAFLQQSSLWSAANQSSSMVIVKDPKVLIKNSIVGGRIDLVSKRSLVVPGSVPASSSLPIATAAATGRTIGITTNTVAGGSIMSSGGILRSSTATIAGAASKGRKQRHRDNRGNVDEIPYTMSHLGLNSTLGEGSLLGYDSVADSIATGQAEFCYVDVDRGGDKYKYTIREVAPRAVKSQEFSTLSRRGIMKIGVEGSEIIGYDELMKDQAIYHKLVQLPVFGKFRLWKTLYLWKHGLSRLKFHERRELLKKKLFMLDEFLRPLLMHVADVALRMRSMRIIKIQESIVYDIATFLAAQRAANVLHERERAALIQTMVTHLCREGEERALLVLEKAPTAVSASIYDKEKAGAGIVSSKANSGGDPASVEVLSVKHVPVLPSAEHATAGHHRQQIGISRANNLSMQINAAAHQARLEVKLAAEAKAAAEQAATVADSTAGTSSASSSSSSSAAVGSSPMKSVDDNEGPRHIPPPLTMAVVDTGSSSSSSRSLMMKGEEQVGGVSSSSSSSSSTTAATHSAPLGGKVSQSSRASMIGSSTRKTKVVPKIPAAERYQQLKILLASEVTVSFTERAALRNHCRSLASFMQLTDYMLASAAYEAAENALLRLERYLVGTRVSGDIMLNHRLSHVRVHSAQGAGGTLPLKIHNEPGINGTFCLFNLSVGLNLNTERQSVLRMRDSMTSKTATVSTNSSTSARNNLRKPTRRASQFGIYGPMARERRASTAMMGGMDTVAMQQAIDSVKSNSNRETGGGGGGSGGDNDGGDGDGFDNDGDTSNQKYVLKFEPSKQRMQSQFDQLLLELLHTGSYTEGVVMSKNIISLLSPIREELHPSILEDRAQADRNNTAHILMESCRRIFEDDYERCMDFMEEYNFKCVQFEDLQFSQSEAESTKLINMSPDLMLTELQNLDQFYSECSQIENTVDVGVFRVDLAPLTTAILEQIKSYKQVFHRLIPDLYSQNGDKFYVQVCHINDVMASEIRTLEEFVKVSRCYRESKLGEEKLQENFRYIMLLREIIDSNDISKSEAVTRQNLTLTGVWQRYNQLMSDFEDKLEGRNVVYRTEVTKRATALSKPIVENVKNFLCSETITSDSSSPEEVLADIKSHRTDIESVLRQGKILEQFQEVLRYSIYSRSIAADLLSSLNSYFLLWSVVKAVQELQVNFMSVNFLDANSVEVERQLRSASSALSKKAQRKESKIQHWVDIAVRELLTIAPIVKKLQSPNLRQHHIDHIHEVVGRNIFDEGDINVGELVDIVNIKSHAQALDTIYEEALFQHNLESKLAEMTKTATAKEFEFESEGSNKQVAFFSNIGALLLFFEDILMSVSSCVKSKFSAPQATEFEAFRVKLVKYVKYLKLLKALQDGYCRIRILFTSARTARYLNHSLRYFKIVDEIWRSLVKTARSEVKCSTFFHFDNVADDMDRALVEIDNIDECAKSFAHDQCVKWPKLFLLDQTFLIEVLGTQDPLRTFEKCSSLFPHIDEMIFDANEIHNATGARCGHEVVHFKKPCSARNGLVEWLLAISTAINDRLTADVFDLLLGQKQMSEEIRQPQTTEQARILVMQLKLWKDLRGCVMQPMGRRGLRPQLLEVNEQLLLYTSMLQSAMSTYQIKTMHNLLIVLVGHRDFLSFLLSDPDCKNPETTFFYESSIKKVWDEATNTLSVKQGPYSYSYGLKYCGAHARLVITPLTNRCFHALTAAMRDVAVPFVHGSPAGGKSTTLRSLTYELGYEMVEVDCSVVTSMETIYKAVRASLGTASWLVLGRAECLPPHIFCTLMTALGIVQRALASGVSDVCINSSICEIKLTETGQQPRMCLLYNQETKNDASVPMLPASVRDQFRMMHFETPPRAAILAVLLTVNNFVQVTKLTLRIDAMCNYIIRHNILDEAILMKLLTSAIRSIGEANANAHESISTQLAMLVKRMFKQIPIPLQEKSITEYHLRFICNLFLEVIYSTERDLKEFKSVIRPSECEDILTKHLLNTAGSNTLLVVGDVGVGKTHLIKQSFEQAANTANEAAAARAAESMGMESKIGFLAERANLFRAVPYPHVIHPFVMADYDPAPLGTASFSKQALGGGDFLDLCNAAERELELLFMKLDAQGPTRYIHLECQSSNQLTVLLPWAKERARVLSRRVKLVWECTELSHIDPVLLCEVPIVPVNNVRYNMDSRISVALDNISLRCGPSVRKHLVPMVDTYIRPCIDTMDTRNSALSSFDVTDNAFKIIASLVLGSGVGAMQRESARAAALNHHTLQGTVSLSKIQNESLQRIVIFACIWSFGVCGKDSRPQFDRWFREHFDLEKAELDASLFPSLHPEGIGSSGVTIFDQFLTKNDLDKDKEESLVWTSFRHMSPVATALMAESQSNTTGGGSSGGSGNQFLPSSAVPAAGMSEERLKKSYFNMYYRSIFNGYEGAASMLVPTASAKALSVVQDCMLSQNESDGGGKSPRSSNTGTTTGNNDHGRAVEAGNLLICGPAGSGKSALVRELIELSKAPANSFTCSERTATHWICRISDCGPKSYQAHLRKCREKIYPIVMERKIGDYGALFIDDVNITMHPDQHHTCAESLRTVMEHKKIFDTVQRLWRPFNNCHTLLCSSNEQGKLNQRFLRHQMVVYHTPDDLPRVFSAKMQQQILDRRKDIAEDICDDIVLITFALFEGLQKSLSAKLNVPLTELTALNIPSKDYPYYLLTVNKPVSACVENVLSKLTTALCSLTVFTSHDVLRVWDRTIADYTLRHPYLAADLEAAQEKAQADFAYMSPSFTSNIEREKVVRLSTLETMLNNLPPGESLPVPLSYQRNGNGFYKTGAGIFCGISTGEYFRELFLYKNGRTHLLRGIDTDSLAFWTDVQTVAGLLSTHSLSTNCATSFTVLSGMNTHCTQAVLQVAKKFVNISKMQYFCLSSLGLDRYSAAGANINTHRTGQQNATPSLLSAQHLHSSLALEIYSQFLKDPVVIARFAAYMKTQVDTYKTSTSASRNTLYPTNNNAEKKRQIKNMSSEMSSLADGFSKALKTRVGLDNDSSSGNDSKSSKNTEGRLGNSDSSTTGRSSSSSSSSNSSSNSSGNNEPSTTLWHLEVSEEFCALPGCWAHVLEVVELRSEVLSAILVNISEQLDPRCNTEIRDIFEEYLGRQRYVVSFAHTYMPQISSTAVTAHTANVTNALTQMAEVPRLISMLQYCQLYDTYASYKLDIAALFGAAVADVVLDLIVSYGQYAKSRIVSQNLGRCSGVNAEEVASAEYIKGSCRMMLELYHLSYKADEAWGVRIEESLLQLQHNDSVQHSASAATRAAIAQNTSAKRSSKSHKKGATAGEGEAVEGTVSGTTSAVAGGAAAGGAAGAAGAAAAEEGDNSGSESGSPRNSKSRSESPASNPRLSRRNSSARRMNSLKGMQLLNGEKAVDWKKAGDALFCMLYTRYLNVVIAEEACVANQQLKPAHAAQGHHHPSSVDGGNAENPSGSHGSSSSSTARRTGDDIMGETAALYNRVHTELSFVVEEPTSVISSSSSSSSSSSTASNSSEGHATASAACFLPLCAVSSLLGLHAHFDLLHCSGGGSGGGEGGIVDTVLIPPAALRNVKIVVAWVRTLPHESNLRHQMTALLLSLLCGDRVTLVDQTLTSFIMLLDLCHIPAALAEEAPQLRAADGSIVFTIELSMLLVQNKSARRATAEASLRQPAAQQPRKPSSILPPPHSTGANSLAPIITSSIPERTTYTSGSAASVGGSGADLGPASDKALLTVPVHSGAGSSSLLCFAAHSSAPAHLLLAYLLQSGTLPEGCEEDEMLTTAWTQKLSVHLRHLSDAVQLYHPPLSSEGGAGGSSAPTSPVHKQQQQQQQYAVPIQHFAEEGYQKFASRWRCVAAKSHHPLRTLSELLHALGESNTLTLSRSAIFAWWRLFIRMWKKSFGDLEEDEEGGYGSCGKLSRSSSRDGHLVAGMGFEAREGEGEEEEDPAGVSEAFRDLSDKLSFSLNSFLLRLRFMLSEREFTFVMLRCMLRLFYDSYSEEGDAATVRLLQAVLPTKYEVHGFVPLMKRPKAGAAAGAAAAAAAGTEKGGDKSDMAEGDDEEEEEEEDEDGDNDVSSVDTDEMPDGHLCESSRHTLKQVLLILSQTLPPSSIYSRSTVCYFVPRALTSATYTSSSNVYVSAAIEKHTDIWTTWTCDIYGSTFPAIGHNYTMTWLDKMCVAILMKPLSLTNILTDAIRDVGLTQLDVDKLSLSQIPFEDNAESLLHSGYTPSVLFYKQADLIFENAEDDLLDAELLRRLVSNNNNNNSSSSIIETGSGGSSSSKRRAFSHKDSNVAISLKKLTVQSAEGPRSSTPAKGGNNPQQVTRASMLQGVSADEGDRHIVGGASTTFRSEIVKSEEAMCNRLYVDECDEAGDGEDDDDDDDTDENSDDDEARGHRHHYGDAAQAAAALSDSTHEAGARHYKQQPQPPLHVAEPLSGPADAFVVWDDGGGSDAVVQLREEMRCQQQQQPQQQQQQPQQQPQQQQQGTDPRYLMFCSHAMICAASGGSTGDAFTVRHSATVRAMLTLINGALLHRQKQQQLAAQLVRSGATTPKTPKTTTAAATVQWAPEDSPSPSSPSPSTNKNNSRAAAKSPQAFFPSSSGGVAAVDSSCSSPYGRWSPVGKYHQKQQQQPTIANTLLHIVALGEGVSGTQETRELAMNPLDVRQLLSAAEEAAVSASLLSPTAGQAGAAMTTPSTPMPGKGGASSIAASSSSSATALSCTALLESDQLSVVKYCRKHPPVAVQQHTSVVAALRSAAAARGGLTTSESGGGGGGGGSKKPDSAALVAKRHHFYYELPRLQLGAHPLRLQTRLRVLFRLIQNIPFTCDERHKACVARMRWLLLLFHTSIEYRLTGCKLIGADTLILAVRAIDDIEADFTSSLEVVPPSAKVTPRSSAPPTPRAVAAAAAAAGRTNNGTGQPSSLSTTSTAAAVAVSSSAAADEDYTSTTRQQHFVDIAKPDLVAGYVIDGIYHSLVGAYLEKKVIKSFFLGYFTPESLDVNLPYYVQGRVPLPVTFEADAGEAFFNAFQQHIKVDFTFLELLGMSIGQVNSLYTYDTIYSIETSLNVLADKKEAAAAAAASLEQSSTFKHNEQYQSHVVQGGNVSYTIRGGTIGGSNSASGSALVPAGTSGVGEVGHSRFGRVPTVLYSGVFYKLHAVLNSLLQLLPEKIKTDTKEILARMSEHVAGGSSSDVGSGGANGKHGHGYSHYHPHSHNARDNKGRRLGGKRGAQKVQSREFDPLWAFLLAECYQFNKTSDSLRRQLYEMTQLRSQESLVQYLYDKGRFPAHTSAGTMRYEYLEQMLEALMDGYVPENWLGLSPHGEAAASSSVPVRVTLEQWASQLKDSRAMIADWLSRGHPEVIKLHLLHNPAGLLFALKETFAFKIDSTIEQAHLHFQVVPDMKSISAADINFLNTDNHGCNLLIGDLYLHNALYNERSEALMFLPDYSASAFGQRFGLQVSVTSHELSPTVAAHAAGTTQTELYWCPLIANSADLPAAQDLCESKLRSDHNSLPIVQIPLPTHEDVDDCEMYRIALHSCPPWRIPMYD